MLRDANTVAPRQPVFPQCSLLVNAWAAIGAVGLLILCFESAALFILCTVCSLPTPFVFEGDSLHVPHCQAHPVDTLQPLG